MSGEEHNETTVFHGMVSARDGRPFVQMTCELDGAPVFAVNLSPARCTALGLRALQAAIEAERDAGLIAFLRTIGGEDDAAMIAAMLVGLREHREQFDPDLGSMRPRDDDDDSEVTG